MEDLPEDVLMVLMGTLCRISKVSVVVFAYVSKNWYQRSLGCARQNQINRVLECYKIAAEGSMEVLKWATLNGYNCDADTYTCSFAAKNGHFEVLKWARLNGCKWDSNTCTGAAKNGHLEILKWARLNGCKWDASTCSNAAKN